MTDERILVEERVKIRYPFIGIVGAVGVGKSEFTKAFVGETGIKNFEEPYQENPYLNAFYTESHEKNSFNSQMFFLIMKSYQMQRIRELLVEGAVIQDPAIDVDFMIAKAHWKMRWMTDKEHLDYLATKRRTTKGLVNPDIYIALTATKETIRKRIAKRGRPMELVEKPEYFDFLVDEFNDWLLEARESKCFLDGEAASTFPDLRLHSFPHE